MTDKHPIIRKKKPDYPKIYNSLMQLAIDIKWDATRKNRACKLKKYLIWDLERIEVKTQALIKILEEEMGLR